MGTVFLDYDGTLHDTMNLYGPAFRTAYASLVEQGVVEPKEFSDAFIASWLGWTIEDMWHTFQPQLPDEVWRPASRLIGSEMSRLMGEGQAALFPGVPEMLSALKDASHTLVLLSNSRRSYCDAHRAQFGLDRWLDDYLISEEFGDIPKWQIYERAAARFPLPHVMVGDRFHDMEVAQHAGIPVIGCAYGFGKPEELDVATKVAASPTEVPVLVRELIG
jgi:phosphoglycolate phosphatase